MLRHTSRHIRRACTPFLRPLSATHSHPAAATTAATAIASTTLFALYHTSPAAMSSHSSDDTQIVIKHVNEQITTLNRPFKRMTVDVGVRAAIIKLTDTQTNEPYLFVYNPVGPIDQNVQQTIAQLNAPVKVILAPSVVHHVFVDEFAEKYPEATVIVPEGLAKKHSKLQARLIELKSDAIENPPPLIQKLAADKLFVVHLTDYVNGETIAFVEQSKTLLVADMVWSLSDDMEQYENTEKGKPGFLQRLAQSKVNPDSKLHHMLTDKGGKHTDRFKAILHQITDQWQPQRLIQQHGNPIEGDISLMFQNLFPWAFKQGK